MDSFGRPPDVCQSRRVIDQFLPSPPRSIPYGKAHEEHRESPSPASGGRDSEHSRAKGKASERETQSQEIVAGKKALKSKEKDRKDNHILENRNSINHT